MVGSDDKAQVPVRTIRGMRVAVGSANPVKVAATERALSGRSAAVAAVDVDSGVPEQPRGHDQTLAGAATRARRALAATDAALGVGIEGGVAAFPRSAALAGTTGAGDDTSAGDDALYLVMWAAVTDGERTGTGAGPSLALPAAIAARIADGAELGPVLDDELGTTGVAKEQGAAGVFTDGIIDRESALVHAVAGALGPFVSELY